MTDDELIQAIIESENRISVAKEDLPQCKPNFCRLTRFFLIF